MSSISSSLIIFAIVILATSLTLSSFVFAQPDCASPFGSFIGQHEFEQQLSVTPSLLNRHATAKMDFYSNCNGDYVSNKFTYVNLVEEVFGGTSSFYAQHCDLTSECPTQIFSGMKYQCVNAGRKSLMQKFGAVFASIPNAVNIFALPNVTQYVLVPTTTTTTSSEKSCKCQVTTANFLSFENNKTTEAPKIGDLLIYNTVGPGMAPTGHVCAVVNVDKANKYVEIVEENWSNAPWPKNAKSGVQENFSRRIEYIVDEVTGRQELINTPYEIMGWKRVGKKL